MTSDNPIHHPENRDRWMIVRADNKGTHAIVRIRTDFPQSLDRSTLPVCVLLVWPYTESANGMPDNSTQLEMSQLETEFESLAYGSETSLLTLVLTWKGVREWFFYVREYEPFLSAVNQLIDPTNKRPISILFDQDPTWNYWNHYSAVIERRTDTASG